MTEDRVAEILSTLDDRNLLAAIRRGDVSYLTDGDPVSSYGYWQRDNLMRGEARRRGIL
jgi:hypothetical protein